MAFTASMSNTEDTHRGPFSTETKLIFDKVLTNIGNAYDPVTGFYVLSLSFCDLKNSKFDNFFFYTV